MKRSQITINLIPKLIRELERMAKAEGRSRSNMAAELINRQLNKERKTRNELSKNDYQVGKS